MKSRAASAHGIHIGDTVITALTGPISFHYLKPTQEVYRNGDAHHFPLIVLFGDSHRSMQYSCKGELTCKRNADKKICQYKLSSKSFLKLLDTLPDPQHPVDFHVETHFYGTAGMDGGVMQDFNKGDMLWCYLHPLRGSAGNKCPTRHIRWHVSDARFAGVKSEPQPHCDPIRELFAKDQCKKRKCVGQHFLENAYLEFQITSILRVVEEMSEMSSEEANDMLPELHNIIRGTEFKTMASFKKFLLTLCESRGKLSFDRFAKALFRRFSRKNSLIYKQVQKQDYPPLKSLKAWQDLYATSLNNLAKGEERFSDKDIVRRFRHAIERLDQPDLMTCGCGHRGCDCSLEEDQEIWQLLILLTDSFLDLYFLGRVFKQPEGGKRSSLSFGYFGDFHVENICYLLGTLGTYEMSHSILATPNSSRCRRFKTAIHLSHDLEQHNAAIELDI